MNYRERFGAEWKDIRQEACLRCIAKGIEPKGGYFNRALRSVAVDRIRAEQAKPKIVELTEQLEAKEELIDVKSYSDLDTAMDVDSALQEIFPKKKDRQDAVALLLKKATYQDLAEKYKVHPTTILRKFKPKLEMLKTLL